MLAIPSPVKTEPETAKDCWLAFLCGTVVMYLLGILLCPRWALQPRPMHYWFFIGATLFFVFLPFGWSIYLLFIYRSSRERIVSYLSFGASVFWLLMAYPFLFEVLRNFSHAAP